MLTFLRYNGLWQYKKNLIRGAYSDVDVYIFGYDQLKQLEADTGRRRPTRQCNSTACEPETEVSQAHRPAISTSFRRFLQCEKTCDHVFDKLCIIHVMIYFVVMV